MSYLILGLIFALYFLPTVIAYSKGKKNTDAIMLLNLFFGWTAIGWVVALIWASMVDS